MDDVFQRNLDEEITALHALEYKYETIAQTCGISEDQVYRRCKRLGLPKRKNWIFWNKERQEQAKEYFGLGFSYARIAVEFGKSRSSVASLMKRMGLVRSRSDARPWNRGIRYTHHPNKFKKGTKHRGPTHITERPTNDGFRHKTLLELEWNECRYPFGTENYTFCALPAEEDSSWCPHHRKICFMSADAA